MTAQNKFLSSRNQFFSWFLLAFMAGSVNAGGFLACQRFVTHVTGFATSFGVDMASGHVSHAWGLLSVPLFFLAGSMISGILVDRRKEIGKPPRYDMIMALIMICMLLSAVGGKNGVFGRFGGPLHIQHDYLLLAMLSLAMGAQNAVVTTVSGSIVRTTHLTGITTDLGIGLIRVLFPTGDEKKRKHEARFNWFRAGTIVSFTLGSAAAAGLFVRFGYAAFLMPAALAGYGIFLAVTNWQKPAPLEVVHKQSA